MGSSGKVGLQGEEKGRDEEGFQVGGFTNVEVSAILELSWQTV